jgi:Flp pilus assembly protein protease CpaA
MFEVIFLFVLGLIWIIFAVVQDLKTREIANWLNFSLIVFALGFRFFYSLFFEANFNFFIQGLVGLGVFFVLGNLFYYSKLFAGGDSKLMIALGPILPIFARTTENLKFFLFFMMVFLAAGFLYILFFIFYLAIKNFKKFKPEFKKQFKKTRKYVIPLTILAILFLIAGFFINQAVYFAIYLLVLVYLVIISKSVDESCMIKKMKTSELTEGDWLYQSIAIKGEKINANWSGLNAAEINLLKKNKKEVLIRQGIQFAPVFLISFVLTFVLFKIGVFEILFRLI